jgi:molecular chaperone DnaJ
VLSDEDQRTRYDRFGAVEGAGPFSATDITGATEFFDALFGDLFGLARRRSSAGRDLRYTLELDFEEAALGCEKTIEFERAEECDVCRGTGAEGGNAGLVTCDRCHGEGVIRRKAGFLTSRRDCMGCGGTGQVPRVRCAACEGAGFVDRQRRYTVRIPAGSVGGSTHRVPREGAPGRRGGPPGDLHVIVRVRPHPFYSREGARDGDVLVIEVPLTYAEAALGADIDVPVLDATVRMRVPPATQAGAVFRLRGKGFPRASGARGDAHVRVVVETPAALSAEARALLEKLGGTLDERAQPRRAAFRAAAGRSGPAAEAAEEPAAAAGRGGGGREHEGG